MIERIRRASQSGLSYILIGMLIVFFAVFFGVPADGCMAGDGQRDLHASVDGDDIFTDEVNVIQNRFFQEERQGSRQQDEDFFSRQAEALRITIAIYLLAQRAEEAGLRVSDEEFQQYMMDPNRNFEFLTSYGRTGQFDGDFYERYVQHGLRVPINSYEEFKERELLARKYLAMLDMHAHVTPDEVEELHRQRNTRVDLEYVQFDSDALIDIVGMEDEDIDDFLDSDDGQQQVEEYFEEHRDDYTEPEEVQLRTIRVFSEDDLDQARQSIQDARARIDDGEDFGDVAREVSEDFYADDGGLIDWTEIDNVESALQEAIDGADVGDIAETEIEQGYALVKLEDRREEQVDDLGDIERETAEELLRDQIVETRGVELAEELQQVLTEDAELTFEEALEQLEEEAEEDEREEDAELWANIQADTTGGFALEEEDDFPMMQQPGMDMGDFGTPWYDVPGIGEDQTLAVAAFELTEDQPLADELFEVNGSRVVVRLKEREEPEEMTEEERLELQFEAQMEKSDELIGNWQSFFVQPTEELAAYIEAALQEAFDDGTIRLFERNSRAAALLRHMMQEDGDVEVEEVIDLPEERQPPGVDLDDEDDEEQPGGPADEGGF